MEDEDVNEFNLTEVETEFAETVGRYGEVLSKCKLLRSRFLMNNVNLPGGTYFHLQ